MGPLVQQTFHPGRKLRSLKQAHSAPIIVGLVAGPAFFFALAALAASIDLSGLTGPFAALSPALETGFAIVYVLVGTVIWVTAWLTVVGRILRAAFESRW